MSLQPQPQPQQTAQRFELALLLSTIPEDIRSLLQGRCSTVAGGILHVNCVSKTHALELSCKSRVALFEAVQNPALPLSFKFVHYHWGESYLSCALFKLFPPISP